jgi:formamidopyrimidine-DNA glycosylase
MPELPEVETSRRGLTPWMQGVQIQTVIVRDRRLRWPVPDDIEKNLSGQTIRSLRRRAKYLLFDTDNGTAMLHLGMSGSVRIINQDEPAAKHDHIDIQLAGGKAMRFRDPRRFGSFLWSENIDEHPLIRNLGPEPLGDKFDGAYLYDKARGRRVAVKQLIMNAAIVVGVGNIYASESLFEAGIHPKRRSDRIAPNRMHLLGDAIKNVLARAIKAGGTTLKDFHGSDGEPGYFQQSLDVYGREGEACHRCGTSITAIVLGQRSTFYCKRCQR